MTISRFTPPLDYLQAASQASLQNFELTRLNHAANLRQEIAALIDQWIEETSQALLARWMLDHKKSIPQPSISPTDIVRGLLDSPTSLFPDPQLPPSKIDPAPPSFATPRTTIKAAITRKPQKQRQSAAS